MNIYLDIDGVILANDFQPAFHAGEFVSFVVENFPTYWLTTHCRTRGDDPLVLLRPMFSPEVVAMLERIQPTYWEALKTEAVDFSQPFLWYEDDLFVDEMRALAQNKVAKSWVKIDLRENPHQLLLEMEALRPYLQPR